MAKLVVGLNDLQTLRGDLVEDWSYEKNSDLLPSDIAAHSNKKVWWKCHICGYEWESQVNDRSNGRGCPVCAKFKRIESFRENYLRVGENDLTTANPEVAAEWDYQKNGNKRPEQYTANSKEKVWWKCSVCGNSWMATISNRAAKHSGCPKCTKYTKTSFPEQAIFYYLLKLYPDAENSYQDCFSVAMQELDIYIPSLKIGIEYDGVAWHNSKRSYEKAKEKYECCKENNIRLIRVIERGANTEKYCDAVVYRESLTEQALNDAIYKCVERISPDPKTVDIDVVRDRSLIMKQYIVSIKEKSIAYKYPEMAKEWDSDKNGLTADMVNATSDKKYWWKCDKGHSYQMKPSAKCPKDAGCPICSGHRLLSGFNDLKTRYPEIAKEWDYVKNAPKIPSEIMPGSQTKYWWKCGKGHSYQMTPNDKSSGNCGCPICSGREVMPGVNDIATTNPELLSEWDYERNESAGICPEKVSAGSGRKVWWKCKKGHHYEKTVYSHLLYPSCPICSARRLVTGVNDLETTHPQLAEEWDYRKNENLLPSQFTENSKKSVWWKCKKCGTEWKTEIRQRTKMLTGCPSCGYSKKMQTTRKQTIIRAKRDLVSKFPEIAKEWDYKKNGEMVPSEVSYGSSKKVWWICPAGHSYEARVSDRTGPHKSGCPICRRIKLHHKYQK